MVNLVIVRHGQSVWNKENKLTGLADIGLSKEGKEESQSASERLRDFNFDAAFTSKLHRASDTLEIILNNINLTQVPVYNDIALNQNSKGLLQGMTRGEVSIKYGQGLLKEWQQQFEAQPPEGESLENIYNRIVPFYENKVLPELQKRKNVLLVAHGNSIRALMMYLENLDKAAVATLNVPTGQPVLYRMVPITVPEPIGYLAGNGSIKNGEQVRQYMAINEKTYI